MLGKEVTITGSYAWGDDDFDRAVEMVSTGAFDPAGWFTPLAIEEGQRAFQELVGGAGRFKIVLEF